MLIRRADIRNRGASFMPSTPTGRNARQRLPGGGRRAAAACVSCSAKPDVAADLWEGLFDVVQERPRLALRQPGDPGCTSRAAGHLGGRIVVDGEQDHGDPGDLARQPGPNAGHPAGGGTRTGAGRRRPASLRACGGMCPLAFELRRRRVDRRKNRAGSRSLNDCGSGGRPVEQLRGCGPLPLRRPHPDREATAAHPRRCTSTWSPNWRCRPTSVAAGVTRAGHGM